MNHFEYDTVNFAEVLRQSGQQRGRGIGFAPSITPANTSGYQITSSSLYHLQVIDGTSESVQFFTDRPVSIARGNFWNAPFMPGQCSFLIEAVRVFGVTSELMHGAFQLSIGNRTFHEFPLWRLALREKYFKMTPLLLSPYVQLRALLMWEKCRVSAPTPVEVFLRGKLAIPLQ